MNWGLLIAGTACLVFWALLILALLQWAPT